MIHVRHAETICDIERSKWDEAAGEEYFLRWDYLLHVERTMQEGFSYHYLLVTRDDRPIIAAPMFVMDLKLDTLLDEGVLKSAVAGLRKIIPGAFRMRTLIIGSPPSVGNFGIAVRGGDDLHAAMDRLLDEAERIGKKERAGLTIVKEMPAGFREMYGEAFRRAGFTFGWDMPNNHLAIRWKDDEEYLGSMRGKSRQAIRKSRRKLEQAGIRVKCVTDTRNAIGRREYDMYMSVLMKSDNIFETLTKGYFADVEDLTDMHPCLIAIMKEETIIGFFLVCDSSRDEIAAMFAGIDYKWNNEYDVYFNLFHEVILHAMRLGKKGVCFGQNTYEVKQRMGCVTEDLFIGFRHRNPMMNMLLSKISPMLLPKTEIKKRRVFK